MSFTIFPIKYKIHTQIVLKYDIIIYLCGVDEQHIATTTDRSLKTFQ